MKRSAQLRTEPRQRSDTLGPRSVFQFCVTIDPARRRRRAVRAKKITPDGPLLLLPARRRNGRGFVGTTMLV